MMTENAVVHIGENSPEQVAYKLMRDIAIAEKIYLSGTSLNSNRDWIIRTYCQCLQAVRNPFVPDDVVAGYKS
jgi:hypothetical protein